MNTLAQASDQADISRRLRQLMDTDGGLWGMMTVHQMVCHLDDSYKIALGRKVASPKTGPLQRTLVKWLALQAPARWPKGVATRPEVKQGVGGSPPIDFTTDRGALLTTLHEFCTGLPVPCVSHPIFGPMSIADWMRWGYLHADHHLRQFGR